MFLALILSAWSLAAPVALQEDNPAPNAARQEATTICKYQARTGTRFKRKTCRTRAQWAEIAENSRRDLKEMADRPQIDISRCQSNC